MNKLTVSLCCACLVSAFVVGYLVGKQGAENDVPDRKTGAHGGIRDGRMADLGSKSPEATKSPDQPADNGGPKGDLEWLYDRVEGSWGDWDSAEFARYSIAHEILSLDEESAAELIRSFKVVNEKFGARDEEVRKLFKSDDFGRVFGLIGVMRLAQLNPEMALRLHDEGSIPQEKGLRTIIGAAIDAGHDLRTLLGTPDQPSFQEKLSAAVDGLAKVDPEGAFELLAKYSDSAYDAERSRLVERIAESDGKKATEMASRLMQQSATSDSLHLALNRWYGKDPESAMEWAKSYSGSGELDVMGFLLDRGGTESGSEARLSYNKMEEGGANPQALSQAAVAVSRTLVKDNPDSAVEWVEGLPEGQPRTRAFNTLVSTWLTKDSIAASQWIGTLGSGPEREEAIFRLINYVGRTDLEAASQWANRLEDKRRRSISLNDVLAKWKQQDPERAREIEEQMSKSE